MESIDEVLRPSRLAYLYVEEVVKPPPGQAFLIVEFSYTYVNEDWNRLPSGAEELVLANGEKYTPHQVKDFYSSLYLSRSPYIDFKKHIWRRDMRYLYAYPKGQVPVAISRGDMSIPITEITPFEPRGFSVFLPQFTIVEAKRLEELSDEHLGLRSVSKFPGKVFLRLTIDVYDSFERPPEVTYKKIDPWALLLVTKNGHQGIRIASETKREKPARGGIVTLGKKDKDSAHIFVLTYLVPEDDTSSFKLTYFGETVDAWSFGNELVDPATITGVAAPEQSNWTTIFPAWFLIPASLVLIAVLRWQFRRKNPER